MLLLLFEQMASEHQPVRLNAEYGYLLLLDGLKQEGPEVIEDRYPSLIDLLLRKLQFFSFERKTERALHIVAALIDKTPILFRRNLPTILEFLLRCFDKFYHDEFMWIIEHFMPIFVKILKYASAATSTPADPVQKSQPILTAIDIFPAPALKLTLLSNYGSTNLVRQVLVRVKSLLGSHKANLVVQAYVVLKESITLLANVPMEKEEAGVFSQEEPDNVVIPNSLAAIFYEFWPSILYQVQYENSLPILNECIKICARVADSALNYFQTMNRFSTSLWPRLHTLLRKGLCNQLLLIKTQLSAVTFLNRMAELELPLETITEIADSVVMLFEPKKEHKEVTIQAFACRLVQLRDAAVVLVQKLTAKWSTLRPKLQSTLHSWEALREIDFKPDHPITTLCLLCLSFCQQVMKPA